MAAIKKKKFFPVEIPMSNTPVELLAYAQEDLNNKTIKLDLTRQLRGKSIEVVFQVKADEEKITAEPKKLTLLPFFIRRMMRKNISYVEDSFSADCEDAQVRIKPFLITRKRVSRAVRKALRNQAREWLEDYVKNKTCKNIFEDIIGNRIQKPLSLKLKKIYPLALCEIRVFKIEKQREQEKLKIKTEKIKGKEEKPEEKEEVKEKEKKVEKKSEKEKPKKEEKKTEKKAEKKKKVEKKE